MPNLDRALDEMYSDDDYERPGRSYSASRPGRWRERVKTEPYEKSKPRWKGDGDREESRGSGSSGGVPGQDCRVGPESDVKKIAGYIGAALRQRGSVSVHSSCPQSGNQALKALALTRSYLKEECLDLTVETQVHEDTDDEGTAVTLEVSVETDDWVRGEIKEFQGKEMFVSKDSRPSKVAGAISHNVREKKQLYLTAMGPAAALKAAQSVYLTRKFLEGESRDVCFTPEFGKTREGASCIYLYIFHTFSPCKVGADSDIHHSAGYVAAGVREGCPPYVLATSPTNINQAVKTLALARDFLNDEGLDFAVRPFFPEYYENTNTACIKISLAGVTDGSLRKAISTRKASELYVSSESDPTKVAGAVANHARAWKQTILSVMGPEAVYRATVSIFLAERYLHGESIRMRFAPEFGKTKTGKSILYLHLLAESGE